jgi:signal transduction histidine kinase
VQTRLRWTRLFFGARTRILAWYVILMASSTLLSTLAIREILLARSYERIQDSIEREIEEFRRLIKGRDPSTGKPFGNDIAAVFDVFLSRNITEEGEVFLTLLDGHLYRTSPYLLPDSLPVDLTDVQRWGQLSRTEQGKTKTPSGKVIYWAEPVIPAESIASASSPQAVFVVIHFSSSEEREVFDAVSVVANVSLAVLVAASILAWIAAGRILSPLRLLTETARSISDSDLSQRIRVQGDDDIAEMAKTFNEMLERLQTAFVNQRNFVNDVSHELRTPITIIRGHLELLEDDPLERQATVELVTDELDRMSRFVEDLLLLAKAEQPNFLNLETVEIATLTEELFAKATALADRRWYLDNKGTGRIVADRQRLTQMMMNLTQNATQYTQPGDVIALGSAVVGQEAHFWVRDTGCGIALEDQQRIFERFVQLARNTWTGNSTGTGTGLGLSIVSAIARAHGGRIELTSFPGRGSTFTVLLPFDPPQNNRLGD